MATDEDRRSSVTRFEARCSRPSNGVFCGYLLLGMRLNRDTERMVLSDLIHDAALEPAGWALTTEPNDKERRFCKRLGIAIVEAEALALLAEAVPG